MALSSAAKSILAGTFMSDNTKLTIGGEQSRLSSVAREAMTELMCEGLVDRELTDDRRACGITYFLTPKGMKKSRAQSMTWMEKHAHFPLVVTNKE